MAIATSLIGRGRRNSFDAIAADTANWVLVVGVPGKKIRVTSVVINHGTTPSSVTFQSTVTPIYPPLEGPADSAIVLPESEKGWFETVAGEHLTATTGTGSTTSVAATYDLVDG